MGYTLLIELTLGDLAIGILHLLDLTRGVIGHAGDVGQGLGRPAQRIGGVGHGAPGRIGDGAHRIEGIESIVDRERMATDDESLRGEVIVLIVDGIAHRIRIDGLRHITVGN